MNGDYQVDLHVKALRFLRQVREPLRSRLEAAIDELSHQPRPTGSKKLVAEEGYRIRVGNYRILYTVDDRARLVVVYRIGDRKDVYR